MVKKVFISVSVAFVMMAGLSCSNNQQQKLLEEQLAAADSLINDYQSLLNKKDSIIKAQDSIIFHNLSLEEKAEYINKYIKEHPIDASVTGNEAPR